MPGTGIATWTPAEGLRSRLLQPGAWDAAAVGDWVALARGEDGVELVDPVTLELAGRCAWGGDLRDLDRVILLER